MKQNEKSPSPEKPVKEKPEKEARGSLIFSSETFRGEVKPRYVEVAEHTVLTGEVGTSPMDLSELHLTQTLQSEQ